MCYIKKKQKFGVDKSSFLLTFSTVSVDDPGNLVSRFCQNVGEKDNIDLSNHYQSLKISFARYDYRFN